MRIENKPKSISKNKTLVGAFFSNAGTFINGTIKKYFGIDIGLDTSNFDKNLDNTISDVQKLADAVDELVLGEVNVPQVQSDWTETGASNPAFIKNKPTIPSDISELTDTTGVIPADISELTDTTHLLPTAGVLDLGAVLTSNATWKGIIIDGAIDSFACSAGDLMQMQASGLYIGANAVSIERSSMLAIATTAGQNNTISLLTYGQFCLTSWDWTPNLPIYVSLNSGLMTQEPPASTTDEVNVCVGFALSADTIFFNPYIAWVSHV